jgi:hypothetical protein
MLFFPIEAGFAWRGEIVRSPAPEKNLFQLDNQASAAQPGSFAFIAFPDTLAYPSLDPAILNSQTTWIVNNRLAENLIIAYQLGDTAELYSDTIQYVNADADMKILEYPVTTSLVDGFLYTILPGNHDTPTTN